MSERTAATAAAALTVLATVAACSTADTTTSTGQSTATRPSDWAMTTSGLIELPHLTDGPLGSLQAGSYQFSFFTNPGVKTPDAVVEVPSGYDDEAAWYVVSHDRHEFLGLWTVGQVDRDACLHGERDSSDPGPSVEDMADALVAQKSTRASAPEPTTLAGHDGLYVEVRSPRDLSRCDQYPGLWNDPGGRGIYGPGQVDLVWILDVDGQRLVVDAAYGPESSASDIDKLTSMVESLKFVA
jgi:hypothetical protein